jgi:hypothetical protein
MTDTEPNGDPAAEDGDDDVDTADVSGGAIPEQLLEDGESDGPTQY